MVLSSKLQKTMNVSLVFAYTGILTVFAAVQQASPVVSKEESGEQETGPSPHLSSPSAPSGPSVTQQTKSSFHWSPGRRRRAALGSPDLYHRDPQRDPCGSQARVSCKVPWEEVLFCFLFICF